MTSTRFSIGISKKIALSLFVLATLLAVFEIGQRVSDWRKAKKRSKQPYSLRPETTDGRPISGKPGGLVLQLHPHLLYRMKPNQQLDGVTINAQGYRGRPWTLEKAAGTVRVVVLGGSTAFGHSATSDDKTPTAVLEATLDARASDRRWEVLNAGTMTYDSRQELVLLTTEVLAYRPDFVVALDGWNDFYHAGLEDPERPLFHLLHRDVEIAIIEGRERVRGLLRWSALYRGLERKLDRRPGPARDFGQYADRPDAVTAYRDNLEAICRVARMAGAQCIVAVQPELFQRADPIPEVETGIRAKKGVGGYAEYARARYPHFVAAARTAATRQKATFLDLTTCFDDDPTPVFVDKVHVNDEGSKRLAERIAEAILGTP